MSKSKHRNYYIGIVIAALIILAILYYFKIYESAKIKKYSRSYLVTSGAVNLNVDSLDGIDQVFSEAAENYFVFVSYTEDEAEYKLETKLKTIIDDYGLKDNFYLVNTTYMEEDEERDLYERLNDSFKLNKDKINSIPIIIYFEKDKKDYKIIDPNKLESFLIKNNFEKVSQ